MNKIKAIFKDQERRQILHQLFLIVTPIAFQNMMSSLVGASDAIMLGFLDQDSLSAVSLATQVAFVFAIFTEAFVFGINVLAAQYWGKGDKKTVEEILAIAMRYIMIVGIIFSVGTFVAPEAVMKVFTNDPNLVAAGVGYLRVVALSYILTGFSQIYFGIMKVCDGAAISSIIGSCAVVINIILNAVFIFGLCGLPKMGIEGAALATVCARMFEVISVLIMIARKKCIPLRIRLMFKGKNKWLHKDYWHYTLPLLLNQVGWGGGVTMYSVIMGHLGTDATAANSVANIVRSIIASLCWGISSGVGIIIGGMLGRGELEKAKREGGRFVRFAILIGVLSGLVILAITPAVLHFVSLSDQAHHYLKAMMFMSCYYIIGNSLNSTIISGIFPAGGDTKFGMVCDLVTLWCVVVPSAALAAFVFKWPILVVAFILTLDEFVKIPAVYAHYMKYKWVRNITRE